MLINTKSIRRNLMLEYKSLNRPAQERVAYYDGCLDALCEVEKAMKDPKDKND